MIASNGMRLFAIAAGFIIWSIAFVVIYAALSIGCRLGWDGIALVGNWSLQRIQLVTLYALHLAAGIALLSVLMKLPTETSTASFMKKLASYTAIAAIFSTAFTFAGTLMLTTC